MKLSIYTFVQNGIYFDYHIVDMLKHHLPLADEIVVVEGYSTDKTFERIRNIDDKIKIYRDAGDRSDAKTWLTKCKNLARERCTGDWCILLDCDEFIPEWEFSRLRDYLATADAELIRLKFTHYYGNYRVYQDVSGKPFPPTFKYTIHRNLKELVVWGDGSDVGRLEDHEAGADKQAFFECHHFGEVRHADRLRHKWRIQHGRDQKGTWDRLPAFLFSLFPHNWLDKDILPCLRLYDGPLIQAVRNNPSEFVRDRFKTFRHLRSAQGLPAVSPLDLQPAN